MLFESKAKPKLVWAPKPDITTYELAQCFTVLIASNQQYTSARLVEAIHAALPAEAQRHFTKAE